MLRRSSRISPWCARHFCARSDSRPRPADESPVEAWRGPIPGCHPSRGFASRTLRFLRAGLCSSRGAALVVGRGIRSDGVRSAGTGCLLECRRLSVRRPPGYCHTGTVPVMSDRPASASDHFLIGYENGRRGYCLTRFTPKISSCWYSTISTSASSIVRWSLFCATTSRSMGNTRHRVVR